MITRILATAAIAALCISALLAQAGKQSPAGDPVKGKAVFEQCAVCHDAASDAKKLGPGLKGLFKRAKLENGKPPTEANIRAVIDAGGNGMPPFKAILKPAERDDLIAYLKTL